MFHRHFGNHRINATLLDKFYRQHKIKKKKIKWVKHINPDKEIEYEEWRLNIKQELEDLRRDHYRIIYLDEAVFTTKTIRNVEYTANRQPLRVPQARLQQPVKALIFAISEEQGVEHYQIFDFSINTQKFIEYVVNLR